MSQSKIFPLGVAPLQHWIPLKDDMRTVRLVFGIPLGGDS